MGRIRHEYERMFCNEFTNNRSKKTYLEGIDRFCDFLKSEGISEREAMRAAKKQDPMLPQQYYNWLVDVRGYRATSAHTYLTSVCKLFHISMEKIEKQPRISSQTIKGRIEEKNARGKAEAEQLRYRRIINFASAVGIRRAEYGKLRGRDIRYDSSGIPIAVWVEKGKGGKSTLQFILPDHRANVLEVVKGIESDEKIFSEKEMSLRTDLHAYRREHAKEVYQYFLSLPPDSKERLRKNLIKTFTENKKGVTPAQIRRFTSEITANRPYHLRGGNLEKAIAEGRPTSLERLSMYGCAVYALSHWRLDVTQAYLQ